ncbi:MAG: hypothetical protein FK730_04985 [Asgard group archaeon]|nr:hypothetical protein [Asgard group archaeon]
MKIVIFASCSKRKSISHPKQPTCYELTSKEALEKYRLSITEKRTVKDMYRGALNISIVQAISVLRLYFEVKYYVVSAGYGIIEENDEIPPYDCTFSSMNSEEIQKHANALQIPQDFNQIIGDEKPDLIYLALGKNYLTALGDWDTVLPCKTIAFHPSENKKVITLPADHVAVQEASSIGGLPIHGVVGYKGDLLLLTTRYLKNSNNPVEALQDLLNNPDDFVYTMNTIRQNMQ